MPNDQNNNILRLWKKHAPGARADVNASDGQRLVSAQSIRNATLAALIVIVIFGGCWAVLSDLTNRVWPWMTLLLGILVGIAVRRVGRGIDWRFPLLAAVLAIMGALLANIMVAAVLQASEMGISAFQVLRSVTVLTWQDFFSEVMTPADLVFAIFAAAIAAFYANPKLSRDDFLALKLWQQGQENE